MPLLGLIVFGSIIRLKVFTDVRQLVREATHTDCTCTFIALSRFNLPLFIKYMIMHLFNDCSQ